jgi:hypothetical protein
VGIHTYILTAYNEDISTSKTAILTVNPAATATPPPTATPLPPSISLWTEAANPTDESNVMQTSADPPIYEVLAGTLVRISWEVINAVPDSILLSIDGVDFGTVNPEGNLLRTIGNSDERYTLTAENAQGVQDSEVMLITARQVIPVAPVNLRGNVTSNTIELEWDYEGNENAIVGFRVYRADMPPGTNFERVARESDLENFVREWEDTDFSGVPCGKAYYVVAVYLDYNGDKQETSSSANSWYSPSCSP